MSTPDPLPPEIAGFDQITELGSGATSVVYRGVRNGQAYAIKLMKRASQEGAVDAMLRFRREAAALGRLKHPGLVRVYEAGEHDGLPYLVMDLLEGTDLEQTLAKGTLEEALTVRYAKVLAGALAEVHRRGMVHRDFKPANVIIHASGEPKIIDFGFVAGADGAESRDQVIGTFLYAAPEQGGLVKGTIDGRADLYALGCVMFECLAGRPVFIAKSLTDLLKMHATSKAPDLRTVRPETRPVLAEIIGKLLQKDPKNRYQTGEGLLADLEGLADLEAAARAGKTYTLGVGDRRSGSAQETPLVGRESELKALKDLWDSVRRGNGSVALVEGEGGSGKTRLVRELVSAARNRGALILTCKCQQGEQVPFGPLREALDDYASRILQLPDAERKTVSARINKAAGDHAPVIRRLTHGLEAIIPPPATEQGAPDQERFYGAVADFFTELARQSGSVLLQVDDVQWLDEASLQVLWRISKRLDKAPFLLAGTSRNDSASEAAREKFVKLMGDKLGQRLVLKPLDTVAVGQLVAHHLSGEGLESAFVEKLAARSNGNPFAIGEYVRALLDLGAIRLVDAQWRIDEQRMAEVALPADVLDLVISRVSTLSKVCVELLRAAAVAGMVFETKLVQQVAGSNEDQVQTAIREAVAANLVEHIEADEYTFVHDRVHEALLSQLQGDALKDVHQRVADELEKGANDKPGEIFALARHYLKGHPEQRPDRVLKVTSAAGGAALTNFSNPEAYDYLVQAVAAAKKLGLKGTEMAQLLARIAQACTRTSRFNEAQEHLTEALTHADDPHVRARLHIELSRCHVMLFNWPLVNEECRKALAVLGQRFPSNRLARLLSTGWFWVRVTLLRVLKLGFGTVQGHEYQRMTLLAETYALWGYMAWLYNNSLNRLLTPRMLYVAHRLGPKREAIDSLAALGMAAGSWYPRVAIEESQNGVRMGEQLGDRALLALARRATSWAYQSAGRWKQAEEWAVETFNNHKRFFQPRDFASVCNVGSQGLVARGYARQGVDMMREGKAVVERADLASGIATTSATLAGCEAMLGDFEPARKHLSEALELLDKRVSPNDSHTRAWSYLWGIVVHLETGDLGEQLEKIIEGREAFGRSPEDWAEIHQHFYMLVAWVRLKQYQAALGAEREKRKTQLDNALKLLDQVANEDLKSSNAALIRAVLAREAGASGKAERLLDQVEQAAKGFDGPLQLHEVACERARVLLARGNGPAAKKQAELAVELAAKNGWKHRVQQVRTEFGLGDGPDGGAKVMAFARAGSMSMVGAGSMVGSASMVLGSHGRPDRYLSALLQVSAAAQGATDPDAQSRAALDEVIKVMGAERAYLFLEREDGSLVMHVGRGPKRTDLDKATGYSTTVVKKARDTRSPVVLTGTEEGALLGSVSAVAHNLRSIMAAPLMLREKPIGVLYVDNQMVKGLFNDYDADVLQAIAGHIAIALDAARTTRLEMHRKEMERDLELTAAVQSLFLPAKTSLSTDHAEVVGFYRPAGQCSGDWWWYEQLADRSVVVLVADVTGHGAAPAMVTGSVAGSFRVARKLSQMPLTELLAELNVQLRELCGGRFMMTMTAIQLFPDGRVGYNNAGGLPMLVLRSDGKLELVSKAGRPLGSEGALVLGTAERQLAQGDRAFIFTDGLSELNLPGGKTLGLKSLSALLKGSRDQTLATAAQRLVVGIDEARGAEPQTDDVTFAFVERRG